MQIYTITAMIFVLVAIITLATVNLLTALAPLGVALSLYFLGMSRAESESEGKNAR